MRAPPSCIPASASRASLACRFADLTLDVLCACRWDCETSSQVWTNCGKCRQSTSAEPCCFPPLLGLSSSQNSNSHGWFVFCVLICSCRRHHHSVNTRRSLLRRWAACCLLRARSLVACCQKCSQYHPPAAPTQYPSAIPACGVRATAHGSQIARL
jgi:hypothetical protein